MVGHFIYYLILMIFVPVDIWNPFNDPPAEDRQGSKGKGSKTWKQSIQLCRWIRGRTWPEIWVQPDRNHQSEYNERKHFYFLLIQSTSLIHQT